MSAGAAASTAATRSLTPQVLTWTPKMASASVLSPSVTATYRMLSPNRASRSDRVAAHPAAVRVQVATCSTTRGSETGPARGWVRVKEVETDRRPRKRHIGLRVQVQQRLVQGAEPCDPHLRRAER